MRASRRIRIAALLPRSRLLQPRNFRPSLTRRRDTLHLHSRHQGMGILHCLLPVCCKPGESESAVEVLPRVCLASCPIFGSSSHAACCRIDPIRPQVQAASVSSEPGLTTSGLAATNPPSSFSAADVLCMIFLFQTSKLSQAPLLLNTHLEFSHRTGFHSNSGCPKPWDWSSNRSGTITPTTPTPRA